MGIDIVNPIGGNACVVYCILHGRCCTTSISWGQGHVIGVATHTKAQKLGVYSSSARFRRLILFEHDNTCAITQHEAVSVFVPGARSRLRIIVALGQRTGGGKATQTDRGCSHFSSAHQHSIGITCGFIDDLNGSDGHSARLEVAVDPGLDSAWEGLLTRLRVTASSWVGDAVETVQVTSAEREWRPGEELRVSTQLETTQGDAAIALIIEELTTSRWLATFSECEPPLD